MATLKIGFPAFLGALFFFSIYSAYGGYNLGAFWKKVTADPPPSESFPFTITGASQAKSNSRLGPFVSSTGKFYLLLMPSADTKKVGVWKASLPGYGWTEQDSSSVNRITSTNAVRSIWGFQVGDVLHIASRDTSGELRYGTFNMATDQWISQELVLTATADFPGVSMMVRSTGDVILLYSAKPGTYNVVRYAIKSSGTWTTNVTVDGGGTTHWYGGTIVPGPSDRAHLFFAKRASLFATSFDLFQRTLRSDSSLEALPASFSTGYVYSHVFGPGTSYVSGADTKIMAPFESGGVTTQSGFVRFSSADTSSGLAVEKPFDPPYGDSTNHQPAIALVSIGTSVYALRSDLNDQDIYVSKSVDGAAWITPSNIRTATADALSVATYQRSGVWKIGYVYSDGGVLKYDEVSAP